MTAASMRVLVTGASGFIGGAAVCRLQQEGHTVIGLDRRPPPTFSPLHSQQAIEVVQSDIRDADAVNAATKGVDAVVHLAAATGVIPSIDDPRHCHETNGLGTLNVLEACRINGVRSVVFASTGGAIAGEQPPPVGEDVRPQPASPYGATKLYGEGLCTAYAASYGMHTTSLRFSNVYGPGSVEKGSIVAAIFKSVLANQPLHVFGDGSATRDFVHVNDIAGGISLALTKGRPGEPYVLGSGVGTSVNALINRCEAVMGHSVEIVAKPSRRGEIHTTWADISKAQRELGFEPLVDLDDGLDSTWSWFTTAT